MLPGVGNVKKFETECLSPEEFYPGKPAERNRFETAWGFLDTKFEETGLIRDFVQKKGHDPVLIDAGIMGTVPFVPQISRDAVARAAGMSLRQVQTLGDESRAIALMAEGASKLIQGLCRERRIDAIINIVGSMGTSLGLAIMRELPIGLPNLMVSTIAFTPLVTGDGVAEDQLMMQSPVDLWGLNVINRNTLQVAAAAIVGMAEAAAKIVSVRPMIGVTTRGIMRYLNWIKPALEARGYEVVVAHCIGKVGGGTFETLVRQGLFSAVLDLCTGEVLEELNGGSLRAQERDCSAEENG